MQIMFDINDPDDIARVQELLSQLAPGTASAAVVAPVQPTAAPAPAMPANVTPMPQQPAAAPAPAAQPGGDDAAKQAALASIRDVCSKLGPAVQKVGEHLASHYGVAQMSALSMEQLAEMHQWCVNLQAQG